MACTIAAGGTAESDLAAALDCLMKQPTLPPFICYRLIQRLVKSNPSPAYVGRVVTAFNSAPGGDLKAAVTAILTDSEALTEGTGKLAEPVLYATNLLRALNANVSDAGGVNSWTTNMGQNVMEEGSVFSYFSPFYRTPVHGSNPPSTVPAPEFQGVNAATSLARANFAWRAVTNGISGTIKIDLTNLQDIAVADANKLLLAVSQALYRGEMSADEMTALTPATKGSTSSLGNVRSTLYAAAAAPQYQVQQ
jgi:uncharacterized protein (DUF1800 family)